MRTTGAGRFLPLPALALGLAVALLLGCGRRDAPGDAGAAATAVTVVAGVDRATVTIGDPVLYTVEVRHPEDVAPQLEVPVVDGAIGGLRVADSGFEQRRPVRGAAVARHWWSLRPDGTGSYVLPPVTVTFAGPGEPRRVESNEVFVEVASVLPEDAADIRDVKPPRRGRSLAPWLWAGAALLALALAAAWWWRRRRRARSAAAKPAPLPHEIALRELDRLRRTDFGDLEELRRYYFEISEVLRRYVEARFGLNATDLTTEEILSRLGELRELPGADSVLLREFLLATDRVKYAASVPTSGEIEQTYELALSFVESTRPRAGEPGTAGAAGGGGGSAGEARGGGAASPPPETESEPLARRAAG
jgi:hypothetical protein